MTLGRVAVDGVIPQDWSEFVHIVTEQFDRPMAMGSHSYIFRGQGRDWRLTPSIFRNRRATLASLFELEDEARRRFIAEVRNHLKGGRLPKHHRRLAWWILMQHHHAPTRLLDWTASPFVAAYFAAVNQPTEDGVMWVVERRHAEDETRRSLTAMPNRPNSYPAGVNALDEWLEYTQRLKTEPARMFFFEAEIQTQRMTAQQTIFGVADGVVSDHQAILEQMPLVNERGVIRTKIIIKAAAKDSYLAGLRRMNITARTLFPGIDGLGRSMAELIRLGVSGRVGSTEVASPSLLGEVQSGEEVDGPTR